MTPKLAARRYTTACTMTMSVYVALIVGVPTWIRMLDVEGPALYALAVLPSLPLIYAIYVIGRFLQEMDEYEQTIQIRRMLDGLAATLAVCSAWEFLEVFADAPRLNLFLVYPMFCVFWGLSCIFIRTAK